MEQYIYINQLLLSDDEKLQLNIKGILKELTIKDKLRMVLYFEHERSNRRFPVPISYNFDETANLQCEFEGSVLVELPYLFMESDSFETCNMYINLEYGYHEWDKVPFEVVGSKKTEYIQVSTNHLVLNKSLFHRKRDSRKGKPQPRQYYGKGFVGTLRYSNAVIKNYTGISFSKRESKVSWFRWCYESCKSRPVVLNRVLFLSERKADSNGNLIRIKEALEHYPDLEIILSQSDKTVTDMSLRALSHIAQLIATAQIIVLDDFYPQLHALTLKKQTSVIQLWHACGAFKTFGFSRLQKPGGASQDSLNHRSYDHVLVSSEKIRGIYSEAFGIPLEHVKALGVPRTDVLFDEGYKEAVKAKLLDRYQNLKGKKVILFAPTFRGDGNRDAFYPAERFDINTLCNTFSEDYVFIIKNHPFVKTKFQFDQKYKHRVYDLSTLEEINDILLVTDILVTDYSSVVFEAAVLDIPMVFYAYDLEDYMKDRDLYYDYRKFVPGPIALNQAELIKEIRNANKNANKNGDKNQFFCEYFLSALDGKSTQRISEFIYHLCIG